MRNFGPVVLLMASVAMAAGEAGPADGNAMALETGPSSPRVQAAMRTLLNNSRGIHDEALRKATLDALQNAETCVAHRQRVTPEVRGSILANLKAQNLLPDGEGVENGVFPPLKNDGGACPQLPLTVDAAPGSNFGGHHSYPGGLAVHEAFNQQSAMNFAALYRKQYGRDLSINQDWVIGAPAWHDWAKTIVFQWKADGTILDEFNFGGNGRTDNNGGPGDSRTGAHHILGLAEAMARGLAPGLVITQASAHAAPSLGNEYKVVNWLRSAAIIARIDPAKNGYLAIDKNGRWRLPPLGHLSDPIDLNQNGEANLLVEYQIHNLSDGDFVESIPAAANAELLLKTVAKQFGYDSSDTATYNTKFRNIVFARIGPERISVLYSSFGLGQVVREIQSLRARHLI